MNKSNRPAPVKIPDLDNPVLPPELSQFMADSVAGVELEYSVDAVLNAAREQTGLDDFGSMDFVPRLECVLQALHSDSDISPFGRLTNFNILVRYASGRLRLEDFIARHPQCLEEEIVEPIVIAGQPRAGTTHLLNLISADPTLRHLPYWESLEPIPVTGEQVDENGEDPRYRRCREALAAQDQILPYFRNMHEMTADHTHEEIELAGLDFSTMLFENYGLVPAWRDYFLSHDQRPHYAYIKKVLKVLQWIRGPRRWILKSPQHMSQLPTLRDTFPDATFVLPHRDPVAILVSLSTMLAYTSRMSRDPVRPREIAAYWQDRLYRMLKACVEDHHVLPAEQTLDIGFDEFMADDVAAVKRIYQLAGKDFTAETKGYLDDYMRHHQRGRFGQVKYDMKELGIDRDEVRELYSFYIERFSLREEY